MLQQPISRYPCNDLPPKISSRHILSPHFYESVIQELVLASSDLGSLMKLQSRCQLGLQLSEGLTGAGKFTSSHMVVSWRPQFLASWIFLQSFLCDLTTWNDPGESETKMEAVMPFMTQTLQLDTVNSALFYLLEEGRIRLCLLKGVVLKYLHTYFKTTTLREVA